MLESPRSGSNYESYDATHRSYDLTRAPLGVEQVLRHFASLGPLERLTVVDGGCGTGAHLVHFASAGVGRLIGVDASMTGLRAARGKLGENPCHHLLRADLRLTGLASGCADGMPLSFVLHHLGGNESGALSEAARICRAGGLLAIVTCTPEQLDPERGSLWYYRYFPEGAASLQSRFISIGTLGDHLGAKGFEVVALEPLNPVRYLPRSHDPAGPLDEARRAGDSMFSFYRDQPELLAMRLDSLRRDIADGSVHGIIRDSIARTELVRQGTVVIARRNLTAATFTQQGS